jgi:hypothetical protein
VSISGDDDDAYIFVTNSKISIITFSSLFSLPHHSIWAQAINMTGSTNSTILSRYVADENNQPFQTVYGNVSFDVNGQNNGKAYLVQYQIDTSATSSPEDISARRLQAAPVIPTPLSVFPPKVVFPLNKNAVPVNFPAPTALQRKVSGPAR